jgi:hypothetical protein
MAKNFASIYASTNDSYAIEQAIYIKAESTRGQLIAPISSDFLYTLSGGGLSHNQPFESSPHRSGRHNNNIIKKKKECSWSLSTYFNIDETLGAAGTAEIDTPVRLLYNSLLGNEDTTTGCVYTPLIAPNVTFSMFEMGDKWSKQGRGCFVESNTMTFPGDGEAKCEWAGSAAEAILVGIGKSTASNSAARTVTLQTGEGVNFPVGSLVMIVKADGVTRSSDTPSNTARTVTAVSGDVVTLSGANLTDADGTSTPVYLCYYEPTTRTGIDNPVTGLKGSVTIPSIGTQVFRMAKIDIKNGHELVKYGFGTDALSGPLFVPGARLEASISVEMNLSAQVLKFFNNVQAFSSQACTILLGNSAGRHLEVVVPKVYFKVPAITVPENGSIPVTFEGTCLQSALDAADEVTVKFI